jgi:hypothetical protein
MDGALYFRVFSVMPIEGVANLNARATTGSLGANADANVAISQTR